jgi:hypothetical protein
VWGQGSESTVVWFASELGLRSLCLLFDLLRLCLYVIRAISSEPSVRNRVSEKACAFGGEPDDCGVVRLRSTAMSTGSRSSLDNLLLAQAVYQNGSADWGLICVLLNGHPLVVGSDGAHVPWTEAVSLVG